MGNCSPSSFEQDQVPPEDQIGSHHHQAPYDKELWESLLGESNDDKWDHEQFSPTAFFNRVVDNGIYVTDKDTESKVGWLFRNFCRDSPSKRSLATSHRVYYLLVHRAMNCVGSHKGAENVASGIIEIVVKNPSGQRLFCTPKAGAVIARSLANFSGT